MNNIVGKMKIIITMTTMIITITDTTTEAPIQEGFQCSLDGALGQSESEPQFENSSKRSVSAGSRKDAIQESLSMDLK